MCVLSFKHLKCTAYNNKRFESSNVTLACDCRCICALSREHLIESAPCGRSSSTNEEIKNLSAQFYSFTFNFSLIVAPSDESKNASTSHDTKRESHFWLIVVEKFIIAKKRVCLRRGSLNKTPLCQLYQIFRSRL